MKALLLLGLLLPAALWADDAADRAAIEKIIAAFNDPGAPPASVWAPGVDRQAERAKLSGGPLSEVMAGRLTVRSIRFPTSATARVDATVTQFSPQWLASRSVPVVVLLKKVRAGWRIAELHLTE